MKILHLTNSKKGGAAIYAMNKINSMNDCYSNTLLSFRSFLFLGFFNLNFSNIYKLFTFFLFKFLTKNL